MLAADSFVFAVGSVIQCYSGATSLLSAWEEEGTRFNRATPFPLLSSLLSPNANFFRSIPRIPTMPYPSLLSPPQGAGIQSMARNGSTRRPTSCTVLWLARTRPSTWRTHQRLPWSMKCNSPSHAPPSPPTTHITRLFVLSSNENVGCSLPPPPLSCQTFFRVLAILYI